MMDVAALALNTLRFRHVESYWLFYLTVSWWVAWAVYWIWLRPRVNRDDWPWYRVTGIALVLYPFVNFAYNIYVDFALVLDTSSVAGTVPADAWWRAVRRRTVQYIIFPFVGLFVAFGYRPTFGDWRAMGVRARATLDRVYAWPAQGWGRATVDGFWLFVVTFVGYLVLFAVLSPLRQLDTGDESLVFLALTPALAVALSLVAGFTEEFLFRGILQSRLRRVMPMWGAIVLQAVFFGLIHSGYGTVGHLVFPMLFGLFMGIVVVVWGLWPAIMIHTLIDLVLFLNTTYANGYSGSLTAVTAVMMVSVVVPATYFAVRYARRRLAQQGHGPRRRSHGDDHTAGADAGAPDPAPEPRPDP